MFEDEDELCHGFTGADIPPPLIINESTLEVQGGTKRKGRPKGTTKVTSEKEFHGFHSYEVPKRIIVEEITLDNGESEIHVAREVGKSGKRKSKLLEQSQLAEMEESGQTYPGTEPINVNNSAVKIPTPQGQSLLGKGTSSRPKLYLLDSFSPDLPYKKLPKTGPVLHR